MPQTFPNMYAPNTQIGASLQNIAHMLIGSKAQEGRAALDAAHAEAYQAQALRAQAEREKALAEAAAIEQKRNAQKNFFPTTVKNVVGEDYADQVVRNLQGIPSFAHVGGQYPMPPSVSRENQDFMRLAQLAAAAVEAGGGNAYEIMNALKTTQGIDNTNAVISGKLPMRTHLQLQGKPTYDVKDHSVIDLLTGALLGQTPHGQAMVETQRVKQQKLRAGGGSANQQNRMVEVKNPFGDGTMWIDADTAFRTHHSKQGNSAPDSLAPGDIAAIDKTVDAAFGVGEKNPLVTNETYLRFKELIYRLYTDKEFGGEAYRNPAAAVRIAKEMLKITAKKGDNWFGKQNITLESNDGAAPAPTNNWPRPLGGQQLGKTAAPPAATAAPPAKQERVKVKTREEALKLPKGTLYETPDGRPFVR